jgi:hypothetical protein
MRYTRVATASFLAAVFLFSSHAGTVGRSAAQAPADAPGVSPEILAFLKPVPIAAGDSGLQKKLKERHNVAVKLLEERINEYKKGVRDISAVFEAARLTADAKLDLAENAQARTVVLKQLLDVAKLIENNLSQQLAKGFGSKADLERARYARLTLEVELLRPQQKAKPGPN